MVKSKPWVSSTNMGGSSLESLVDQLYSIEDGAALFMEGERQQYTLPSRVVVEGVVESLRSILFPGYFGPSELTRSSLRFYLGCELDGTMRRLREQVKRGLCFACHDHPVVERCLVCENEAERVTARFVERLPVVRRVLATDVRAAFEGDPAATSRHEAIFSYPGVFAVTSYRLAHELYVLGVPLIPRIVTELAHGRTGIDIHPGAVIGEGFFIDHGTGVVIGQTCCIGRNVRLYQGVTLGAKSFALDEDGNPVKGVARHPIVEDDVIIYSGATVLGRVTIGRGSVIGGNVWLTHSVPAGSRVVQMEARQELYQQGAGI